MKRYFTPRPRVWAYGMSLRLQSVYLAACDGLSIYGATANVHALILA